MSQREALDRQVEAMATGPEHSALVESCRAIADFLDASVCAECGGGLMDDKILREYRLALGALAAAVGGPLDEAGVSSLIEEIRDAG